MNFITYKDQTVMNVYLLDKENEMYEKGWRYAVWDDPYGTVKFYGSCWTWLGVDLDSEPGERGDG